MSSPAEQLNLVLTRRLADGTVEWIPIESHQRLPAAPGTAYALIDRTDYEAPLTLIAQRQGQDLVVEVSETEVLVLGGFFATLGVAFYPTTDIAGGAGPFSGLPLTPDSPVLNEPFDAEQIVWTAEPGELDALEGAFEQGGGTSPLLWGGIGVAGLGLAAAAGGGGGGGGSVSASGSSGTAISSTATSAGEDPAPTSSPQITSRAIALTIDENSGANQVVYTATATDDGVVTWSLQPDGDAEAFNINPDSGAVTLVSDPDFEAQPSYTFTVVATDDSGNSSQQAVSLNIGDRDDSAPLITSGRTAAPIDENSGTNQVVYAATAADDDTVTWSLRSGGDAFNINPNSGAVTLLNNPDFEAQPSYTFTVVATDGSGNSSQQAISLAINDLDEIVPTVSRVTLTSADGIQNNKLNAGDTVTVTVTMSENVNVDSTSGTPRIALNIGGSTTFADYASGSGTSSLNFDYIVRPGDSDDNGIRIRANSLESNGGSLTGTTGNAADLSHGSTPNNASYLVDTTAPILSSSTPADEATAVAVGDNIVLTFSENVQTGSGNLNINAGSDTRTIDITDGSQVSISGNQVTINPTSNLTANRTYNIQIDSGALMDEAGNVYAGIDDSTTLRFDTGPDTSIVVFDLVGKSSSDHSDRTFQSGVSYDIYIRVDSDDVKLSAGGKESWEGAANLGSDDRIILVGDGAGVQGPFSPVNRVSVGTTAVAWLTAFGFEAGVVQERSFTRATGFGRRDDDDVRLFDTALPAAFLGNQGGQMSTMYLTNMPAGILTSQGLV